MNKDYTFYRTEIRMLQDMCKTNEEFLRALGRMVGKLNEELDSAKHDLGMAEDRIRKLENGE